MLALQSAPLHLTDKANQERRFDQSCLFAPTTATSTIINPSSVPSPTLSLTASSSSSSLSSSSSFTSFSSSISSSSSASSSSSTSTSTYHPNHPRHHSYHSSSTVMPHSHHNLSSKHHHPYQMPQPQSGSHHHQRYPSTPSVPYYAAGQQQQHTGTQYPLQQYIQQPQQQQQYQYQQLLQQHCQQQQQFQPQPQFQYTQQTPIHKIQNRISQMTVDDFAKEKIVLLLTGSFCPIHLHHTEMLEAAKAHMERIDPGTGASSAIILGGFLSPSHDLYVGEKLRGEDIVLDSDQRLELCRLQTRDSNWIDVDPWESTQDSFFDFHKVTSRLQRYLTDRCQWMLEQKLDALSYLQQLQPPQQQQQHQQTFSQQQPHLNSKSSSLCHPMVAQGSGSPRQSARNPYKIRVVYLCGADFVLRTGARHLVGGIAVVDRPLGDPASKRRSILLTHNGGSIEVDVSTTMLRSPSQEAEDSESNGPASPTSSTGSMSVRDRVFEQLEDSYGHEWCDASRNNIWWLPSRSRTDSEDISSTRIRNLLAVGKSCKGLLHPLVAQRILEHMIEPESSSAEDH